VKNVRNRRGQRVHFLQREEFERFQVEVQSHLQYNCTLNEFKSIKTVQPNKIFNQTMREREREKAT
jgi:hypothetical protein